MLGSKSVEVEERQYFKQRVTLEEVRELAARLPGGLWDILSTRSRRYKEMNLAERQLSAAELEQLLVEEPGLWRRPIILSDGGVVIGYDQQSLDALLS